MRYFRIPIYENDKPDIADTDNFDLLFYIGDGKTVYGILIDGVVRPSWEEITEEDFELYTIGSQEEEEERSQEQMIIDRLEKMQQQLNSMEQTQNYLMGLQISYTVDVLTPSEESCSTQNEECELQK